jgi:phosphoribosylformylglycinamidine cyclo-ligase
MATPSELPPTKDWYATVGGVDYSAMDPFKLEAQTTALTTLGAQRKRDMKELPWSRGESAHLMEIAPGLVIGSCIEGLGTKNIVADALYHLFGDRSFYESVAQDTVAMIVNDLITVGISPYVVNMHIDTGHSAWFSDKRRRKDLCQGWAKACQLANAVWGCGESAALPGITHHGRNSLSGAAWGFAKMDDLLRPDLIEHGDAIVLLQSSGIHANGLSAVRKMAKRLQQRYQTPLSDGRMLGEALLDPTPIYVSVVEECIRASTSKERYLHYGVNITGHGWRKLMRAKQSFEYIIEAIPDPQPVFHFIQKTEGLTDRQAYETLNMGAGFALFVPERNVGTVITIAKQNSIHAFHAGTIKRNGKRRVNIKPLKLVFEGESLSVR